MLEEKFSVLVFLNLLHITVCNICLSAFYFDFYIQVWFYVFCNKTTCLVLRIFVHFLVDVIS